MLQSQSMKRYVYILTGLVIVLIAIHAWSISTTTGTKDSATTLLDRSLTESKSTNATTTGSGQLPPLPSSELSIDQSDQNLPLTSAPPSDISCVRSGCGGMDCVEATNKIDADDSCVSQPHFACFDHAVCEKQDSGNCGWTQTDAFTACIIGYLPGLE